MVLKILKLDIVKDIWILCITKKQEIYFLQEVKLLKVLESI